MSLDLALFFFFYDLVHSSEVLEPLVFLLAEGSIYLIGAPYVFLALTELFTKKRIGQYGQALLAAVGIQLITLPLIYAVYIKERPYQAFDNITPLLTEITPTFPSGHTLFVFSLATLTYFFSPRWSLMIAFLGLIMGIARVMAGVHYPSDIFGGIVLGILLGFLVGNSILLPKKK